MSAAPTKGKRMADLLRKNSSWASNLEDTTSSRWYRLSAFLAERHFKISHFKSCIGFVPLTRRWTSDAGVEKFSYAAQLLFRRDHDDFENEFSQAQTIYTSKGKALHAVAQEDVWKPVQRLYLSGLPTDVKICDLQASLSSYAEFLPSTAKIFHMTDEKFSGQVLLIVRKILKTTTGRIPVMSGPHAGVTFTVVAKGQDPSTPTDPKTLKPCFCCKSLYHEVKNCPTKKRMTFSWECTQCGLKSLKCYEGCCAFDQIVHVVDGMGEVASSLPSTRKRAETIEKSLAQVKQTRDYVLEKKRDFYDRSREPLEGVDIEKEGRAFKRYFYRDYKKWEEVMSLSKDSPWSFECDKRYFDLNTFVWRFEGAVKRIYGDPTDTSKVFEPITRFEGMS